MLRYDFMKKGVCAVVFGVLLLSAGCERSNECPEYKEGIRVGGLKSNFIIETSGIVASRQNSGVFWIHNDSGDSAKLYAIKRNGELIGTYIVLGAGARDWEDIAIGPGPEAGSDYLYIGDIGDNGKRRRLVTVYRVLEPKVDEGESGYTKSTDKAERIRLKYPGGSVNAETLIVDPASGDIYIITKSALVTKVFKASYPQSTSEVTLMEEVGSIDLIEATAGDISHDGKLVIVKNKKKVILWVREPGSELSDVFSKAYCRVPVMPFIFEFQGEAVCFDSSGSGYYTIGEGLYSSIFYFEAAEK